jgi:hypothetical protein
MRSASTEGDRTLSRLVPRWLEMLPPESRPDYLCVHFPRIANRLALCWLDPALTVQLLDDFLRDKRGARRGFPPHALAELKSLRQIASQRVA